MKLHAVRHVTYPGGPGRALVFVDDRSTVLELDGLAATLLAHCQEALSLDEHLEGLLALGIPANPVAVRTQLQNLADIGLLRPVVRSGPPDADPPARGEIHVVGIPTADRPQLLKRCLASLARQCATFGHEPAVFIVDGSRDVSARKANEEHVSRASRLGLRRVEYIGHREAKALRERLAPRVGVAREVLDYGLTPGSTGANSNLLALLSAGRNLLMIDDDIVLETWSLPKCGDRVRLAHVDQFVSKHFASRNQARAATMVCETDVLAAHAALLGRSLASLMARGATLEVPCQEFQTTLADENTAVVRATFTGLVGDSGMSCPDPTLFASGAVRDRFCTNEVAFRMAMHSREIFRVAPDVIVTHEPFCMSYCMALSQQSLLPPFVPIGRDADTMFGELLAACAPSSLFAHLPFGVLHDSSRQSKYAQSLVSATVTGISDVMLSVLSLCKSSNVGDTVSRRLHHIANVCLDLGSLSGRAFTALVLKATLARRAHELHRAEYTAAREYPDAEHWNDELSKYRKVFNAHVTGDKFCVPHELRSNADRESQMQDMADHVRRFGEFAMAWPHLSSETERAHAEGHLFVSAV